MELSKDDNIVVTSADKGGGVIVMDKSDYDAKMQDLLSDPETYKKIETGTIRCQSVEFNKKTRKILRSSTRGRQLQHLLEETPVAPKMRGLPKVHKPGVPMRPITSGIGSAPHRLAKVLAKPLTQLLGTVNDSHLKNSGDLLSRLNEVDLSGKKLASFDVKALFTSVPVEKAIIAIKKAIQNSPDVNFPVPKSHFIQLVELCLDFQVFSLNGEEFQQIHGLAMGSPLSPVAACLYMEMMETDHYFNVMGDDVVWYRYVDDVLLVAPDSLDLSKKITELNAVERRIQFTLEEETNNTLPFLDVHIERTSGGIRYKVYRKITNKEDYIHFFSAHNRRTKSGVVIGFFLRAMRICSPENLKEECDHITDVFRSLRYPRAFIIECYNKAKRIRNRTENGTNEKPKNAIVVVPRSQNCEALSKMLKCSDIQIVEKAGMKIGQVVSKKKKCDRSETSLVYKITCKGCTLPYFGETSRGLKKRLMEHKRDFRNHNTNNAMVKHAEKCGRLPDWDHAEIIRDSLSRSDRKTIESSLIESCRCINSKAGDIRLGKSLAVLLVRKRLGISVT